jgi:hypothetical protein
LAHEADLAKTAIGNALAELKTNIAKAGDIKLWAHHYPWVTLGVAAATGFTLATVAASGGDASATEGEEESRQRLVREAAAAPYNSAAVGPKPKLGESLLGSLFSLARTALEASLVSAIRADTMERAQANAQTGNAVSTVDGGVSEAHTKPAASDRF